MDGGNDERCKTRCFSPWSLLCCCLSKEKRGGSELSCGNKERDDRGLRSPGLDGGDQSQPASPGVEVERLRVVPHLADMSGQNAQEHSEIIELRKEMNPLVHNAKTVLEDNKEETTYQPSDSNNNDACSDGKHTIEIDQLIADELESELELMLRNQSLEVPVDNKTSEGHSSGRLPEATDDGEMDARERSGVCPHELGIKLDELIQSKQQEKIEELEASLQRANQKLLEREKEVSWWKDSAKIFSNHVASRLSRTDQNSHQMD